MSYVENIFAKKQWYMFFTIYYLLPLLYKTSKGQTTYYNSLIQPWIFDGFQGENIKVLYQIGVVFMK